ncbi:pyridoxal-phosphate dependent enzyme [Shimia marina]|uniref:Diaminopropionate ammonia-lyase n=1 Tax=Shimia marina TaxID=321267 RepID=A0A0P1EJJ0_9RHOB|nr:pyridoxal-phosphate dependent enzyme [Shimia marina]CUH50691.1 Diaminopropionate ammonia-lyase [Shimia marina]SFE36689.1 diaminopropionate ammonia-lyase [Shimia marina]
MCDTLTNPHRSHGLPRRQSDTLPSRDAAAVARLLALCPAHAATPLHDMSALAEMLQIARFHIKDERARMGLGSFKALGAAYAIAHDAARAQPQDWARALTGRTYVTASAGNHGLSVAAGARLFGAKAVIYLSHTVPAAFGARLEAQGAEVAWAGEDYEASMAAAAAAAEDKGWTLLSDSTWAGSEASGYRVMEGYLQMASEAAAQIPAPPTHIFLQAGVGGLAAAVAAFARATWGDAPQIIVVEPEAAPALIESIRAGQLVDTSGPVSEMGRLDCKTASMVALNGLAMDADTFVTISEQEARAAVEILTAHGIASTPSGVAGVAAALLKRPNLGPDARILTIVSEGPEDV